MDGRMDGWHETDSRCKSDCIRDTEFWALCFSGYGMEWRIWDSLMHLHLPGRRYRYQARVFRVVSNSATSFIGNMLVAFETVNTLFL